MTMQYVRNYYGVPAYRGQLVKVDGRPGKITKADHRIWVRFDGEKHSRPCHPRWKVEYYSPTEGGRYLSCPEDERWTDGTGYRRRKRAKG